MEEETCPKCDAKKEGPSCPKCGLVFARFDPAVLDEGVSQQLKKLWEAVEGDWDNQAAHAVFVEHSLLQGAGAYATRCYRSRKEDPKAREQLQQITKRLEQMLLMSATPKRSQRASKSKLFLAFVLLATCAAAALLYVLMATPK